MGPRVGIFLEPLNTNDGFYLSYMDTHGGLLSSFNAIFKAEIHPDEFYHFIYFAVTFEQVYCFVHVPQKYQQKRTITILLFVACYQLIFESIDKKNLGFHLCTNGIKSVWSIVYIEGSQVIISKTNFVYKWILPSDLMQ